MIFTIFAFIMEIFWSDCIEDGILKLNAEESGHCVKVLRHREGDGIAVIDGVGNLYRCELLDADARGATAAIKSIERGFGAHPYRLTMAVCPTKNTDRYEWFVEKATEIGVDAIVPVIGERSERKVLKTERLRRIILSAAKQSLKGTVPAVEEPVSVRDFIAGSPGHALNLICHCMEGEKSGIAELLQEVKRQDENAAALPEIRILIGPEGDFSPEEAALALERGWKPVTLGKSRLRTETAALVAVTQVYSAF